MSCGPMTEAESFTEDGFLGGRLVLCQRRRGHRAGHDAILLAAATVGTAGNRVVDFGTGVGAAGLALARRVGGLDLVLVEIDPGLADLARHNAAVNALPAEVLELDVTAGAAAFAAAGLPGDSVDAVLMNPPFNDPGRHRASPDPGRSLAHQADATTLDGWVHAARRVLRPGGALTLIWRAETLAEVMAVLARGFGSLSILPVHPDPASPAIRVLVRAVKGGRAPMRLLRGIALNDAAGQPHPALQGVMRGEQPLTLAGT